MRSPVPLIVVCLVLGCAGNRGCAGAVNAGDGLAPPFEVQFAALAQKPPACPGGVKQFSQGLTHGCGLCEAGRIVCWQTGHSSNGALHVPFGVPLRASAVEVTSGSHNACARFADGSVDCFTAVDPRPATVEPAGTIERLAHDSTIPCGFRKDRTALCWMNDATRYRRPDCAGVACGLESLGPLVDLFVTDTYGCAVKANAEVVCWGQNGSAQSGERDTSYTGALVPFRKVFGLSGVVAVAGADFPMHGTDGFSFPSGRSCAVTGDGRITCWGYRPLLAADPGPRGGALEPTTIVGVSDAIDVAVTERSLCVLHRDGRVSCRGDSMHGDGTDATVGSGLAMGIDDAVALGVGIREACVLRKSGDVECWGHYLPGSEDLPVPGAMLIAGPPGARGIAHGLSSAACALDQRGRAFCFGRVSYADQAPWLGSGVRAVPTRALATKEGLEHVASHWVLVCASRGRNVFCETFEGAPRNLNHPVAPSPLVDLPAPVVELDVGVGFVCARLATGDVHCWGENSEGQLGDGTRRSRAGADRVLLPGRAVALGLATNHGCAGLGDGSAWCWGGHRSTTHGGVSGVVAAATPVREIEPGAARSFAFLSSSVCALGREGIDCVDFVRPERMSVRDGVGDIRALARSEPLCGLTNAGGAICWLMHRDVAPTPRVAAFADVAELAGTCATTREGRIYCWGALGQGLLPLLPRPIPGLTTRFGRARPAPADGGTVPPP